MTAQRVTVDVVIPAGLSVTNATGDGYKGVHPDAETKLNMAEWQLPRLAPKETQSLAITLSQAPSNPADLKGTVRWAKPAPKAGPNTDAVNFAYRPPQAARN